MCVYSLPFFLSFYPFLRAPLYSGCVSLFVCSAPPPPHPPKKKTLTKTLTDTHICVSPFHSVASPSLISWTQADSPTTGRVNRHLFTVSNGDVHTHTSVLLWKEVILLIGGEQLGHSPPLCNLPSISTSHLTQLKF